MKKVVMFAVVGLMMVVAQAASVSWASGTLLKGNGGSYLPAGDIKMYVFEFASADALAAADIASLDVSGAKLSGATTKSTAGITLTDASSYAAGDSIYSAVLIKATEGGKDYVMVQKLTSTVDGLDSPVAFSSLGKKDFGTGAAMTWTEAGGGDVPEPTSGLLLLLGGAMLALRRKQK